MTQCELITLRDAEELTGLPVAAIAALAESGEVSSSRCGDDIRVSKASLLGWCRLFARVFSAVVSRYSGQAIGSCLTARNLTWMAQAGLLTGKERVRL